MVLELRNQKQTSRKKYILIIPVVLVCVVLTSLIALNMSSQPKEGPSQQSSSPQLVSISGKLEKEQRYLFAEQLGPGMAGWPMYFIQHSGVKYYLKRGSNKFYTDIYFYTKFGDGALEGVYSVTGYKASGFYQCIDKENDNSHTVLHINVINVVTLERLD